MEKFYEVMTFLDDTVYSYWEKEDGEIFCHMCGQLGDETVPFDDRRFCPHCKRRMITDSVYKMLSRIATRLNKNRLNREFGLQVTLSDLEESYLKKDAEIVSEACERGFNGYIKSYTLGDYIKIDESIKKEDQND